MSGLSNTSFDFIWGEMLSSDSVVGVFEKLSAHIYLC